MLMDFFFVMSGFLISGAYADRLRNWRDIGRFTKSRFARLWPLHAAMLALFVAIEAAKAIALPGIGAQPPFTGSKSISSIFTNIAMIHSLGIHHTLTWNAPSWTVSVEFYTYLIFALSCVFLPNRPVTSASALAAVGAVGVIFIARKLDANYDYGLFRCFYGFFCGVLTRHVFAAAPPRRRGRRTFATSLELVAVLGAFTYIIAFGGGWLGYGGPLIFSGFIWLYAGETGGVAQLFAAPPLVRLGEISYSIYLVHFPIIVLTALSLRLLEHVTGFSFLAHGYKGLDQMVFIEGPKWILDAVMAVYLLVVIAVANLTYAYIETPGRRIFDAPYHRFSFKIKRRAAHASS